jgi:hypothetical protein
MSGDSKSRAYIRLAQEEQQQYAQVLLAENERLRTALARLENDHRHADERSRVAATALESLRAEMAQVGEQNQQFVDRYQQIEIHSSNLANLYVASYQLHTSIDRETVLRVIQEIVINLVGSEQMAVFEVAENGAFSLTDSFGVDSARLRRFTLGDGPIARRVRGGEIYVNPGAAAGQDQITACIPLSMGASVFGAILIFRLLDHKTSLQPVDHEIFDLLAVHAATALYCATMREKLAGAIA